MKIGIIGQGYVGLTISALTAGAAFFIGCGIRQCPHFIARI